MAGSHPRPGSPCSPKQLLGPAGEPPPHPTFPQDPGASRADTLAISVHLRPCRANASDTELHLMALHAATSFPSSPRLLMAGLRGQQPAGALRRDTEPRHSWAQGQQE